MDLVESVRLMAANEIAVINHWRGFVYFATSEVLPRHHGRLVKSLGDGIMAEFDAADCAASAALALHLHFKSANEALPAEERLLLRAGLNATQVYVDDLDIYGAGVNLAARVASLAGPGETLVTAQVRDQLADGLTAELEDMGDCHLKHIQNSVRVYRLGPAGPKPVLSPVRDHSASLEPAIAVIPFNQLTSDDSHGSALGDAIADDIIAALSGTTGLRVISRLSTVPFRGSGASMQDIRSLLGAAYVISGQFSIHNGRAHVRASLCGAVDGRVLWADARTARVEDIFHGQDTIIPSVAANAGKVILQKELERTRVLPLSNLESYSLFIGSIAMLHRFSQADFMRSRELLDHLSLRHPTRAAPYAMTAKWHLMRILQGWSSDAVQDGLAAMEYAQRALRCDPANPFALGTEGFLEAHLHGDLTKAQECCRQALNLDPQEAQVWRMLATVHSYAGNGSEAECCALHALSLTPMDPTRFIFELVVGASKLSAGKYEEALHWADRSLKGNVMHVPTHRLRVIALSLAGHTAQAREAAAKLQTLSPRFSVDAFARTYPGRLQPHAQSYFHALRSAGLSA